MYIFIYTYVYLYVYKTMTVANYKVTIFVLGRTEIKFWYKIINTSMFH